LLGLGVLAYRKCDMCHYPNNPTVYHRKIRWDKDFDDLEYCVVCKYVTINGIPIKELDVEKKLQLIKRCIDRDVEFYLHPNGLLRGLLS